MQEKPGTPQPFQFTLARLFGLMVLVCACLAAFRWLPTELHFYVFVSLAGSVAIAAMLFLFGWLLWVVMEAIRKIIRRSENR
jgi:hypothetical protein